MGIFYVWSVLGITSYNFGLWAAEAVPPELSVRLGSTKLLRLGTVPNQARKRGSGNPLAGFVLCLYSSVHVFTIRRAATLYFCVFMLCVE